MSPANPNADLKKANDVVISSKGEIHVSIPGSKKIAVFSQQGTTLNEITSVLSPEGEVALKNPQALFIDSKDFLYLYDAELAKIVVIKPGGKGFLFGQKGSSLGQIDDVLDIAVDGEGYIYVLNGSRKEIDIFSPQGRFVTWIGQAPNTFSNPCAIGINGNNELYILDKEEASVFMYDLHGNLFNTHRTLARRTNVSLSKPIGMVVLLNGDFAILDAATNSLSYFNKIAVSGGVLGSKGASAKGVFENIGAVGSDAALANHLVLLDVGAGISQTFKIEDIPVSLTTEVKRARLIDAPPVKSFIAEIAVAPDGKKYVIHSDKRQQVVVYKKGSDNEFSTLQGSFQEIASIATDAESNLLVLDRKEKEVIVYDSKGVLVRKLGKAEKLKDPISIAVQKSGNILVVDHVNGNIHCWNKVGVYQKIITDGEKAGIKSPRKIQVDSKDQLYVWDEKQNAIIRIASAGWPITASKLFLRSEKHGKDGLIVDFYMDPMNQLHLFNGTTNQLEVHSWDQEPLMQFSIGFPGDGINGFSKVDNIVFDKQSFYIYFLMEKGTRQKVYQYMLKPPRPENNYKFDVVNGKLQVSFNNASSASVSSYGLLTANILGKDTLVAETNGNTLILPKDSIGEIKLKRYQLVSISYTDRSEPTDGFDNYLGYADRLLASGKYEEAFVAYKSAINTMGNAPGLTEYIATQLSQGGTNLADNGEVARSLQYLKQAYAINPNRKETKDAYQEGISAFFIQLANRGELDAVILEAERMMVDPVLKPTVLASVDDAGKSLASQPNLKAINNAITLQRKLTEWAPQNAENYHSLAKSCFELYRFKQISGDPVFELEAALKEADRYAKQSVDLLKKEKKNYHTQKLLHLKILNAYSKYEECEKQAVKELIETASGISEANAIRFRAQLAQAYAGQSKHNLAVLEYKRILEKTPDDAEMKIALAEALTGDKKYDEAKHIYQQLLINDRENAQLTAQIGKLELAKGNFVEASFMLEKATKQAPSDKSFYGPLAEAFDGASNYQRAINAYGIAIQNQEQRFSQTLNRHASEKETNSVRDALVKYLMNYATLNGLVNDFEESIKAYNKVIEVSPNNAEAYYGLGKTCLTAGLLYDAEKALYSACRINPAREEYTNAHTNAIKMREQQAKNLPPLSIADINVKEILPSLYRNYSDIKQLSLGEVVVANNTSMPITPSSISVYVKDYMSQPTHLKPQVMVGFSNTYIKLSGLFSDKILQNTTTQTLQLQVEISYYQNGENKKISKTVPFTLQGRNAIYWSDKRCLGAFVSSNVIELIDYNKKVEQLFKSEQNYNLNKALIKALQLYTLLSKGGIIYSPDPNNSFASASTNTEIMDFLQYPLETLKRKSGDCDDLVTLYMALLENAGVATAYIDVPGHVFMAFDSQVNPDRIIESGLNPLEVIVADNKVWIPIETTLIGSQNFMVSWQFAAKRYYEELTKGNSPELVSLSNAHNVYVPSNYVPEGFSESPIAGNEMLNEYNKHVVQLLAKTKREVIAEAENRYLLETENVFVKNRYAMLLAQTGDLAKSEKILLEAYELSPSSSVVLNNLGNLYYLKGNADKSTDFYQLAIDKDARDTEILINLCKAFLLGGKKDQAKVSFDKAVLLNPELEYLYRDLKKQIQ